MAIVPFITPAILVIVFVVELVRGIRHHRQDIRFRIEFKQNIENAKSAMSEWGAELKTLIQENTKISNDAFHEANTVNLKLARLGLARNAQEAEHTTAMQRLINAVESQKDKEEPGR